MLVFWGSTSAVAVREKTVCYSLEVVLPCFNHLGSANAIYVSGRKEGVDRKIIVRFAEKMVSEDLFPKSCF